jgi:L-iditol 2-dehydrogenase
VQSIVLVQNRNGGGSKVHLAQMEDLSPGPGELVVKMEACGLCGTDLEKMRGEYIASMPVLGHEATGVVAAVGQDVSGFKKGDRVFPHHHVPCYECYFCKSGSETMCDMYRKSNIFPGGFSEYIRVPSWNVSKGGVLKLPNEMSFETGALIEPVACCLRAIRSHARSGETVLIAGAGPVGLMHALLLEPMEVKVMVSDVSRPRLDFAEKIRLGLVLDASKEEVPTRVKSETQGRGADLAIIASGSKDAIIQGLASVRKGGRVCLFGVPSRGSVLGYDISELYNSGQQLVTSYGATDVDTKEAMGIVDSNPEFGRLITDRFPLSRFGEAVEAASGGRAMKVVITP